MKRTAFLAASAATALLGAVPRGVRAAFIQVRATTQLALFDALPRARTGQWVRLIMGSGVAYQKQIGLGAEATERGTRLYVETQIGTPGGSCIPNTLKRVYVRGDRFGSLVSQESVLANVANSGTTLTRWGDIDGGQTQTAADARLRLLDAAYLYDDRTCHIVSVARERLALPFGSILTNHIVARFAAPADARHRLSRIDVWTSPTIPYGVAKYRAVGSGRDPFEAYVFSYGHGFKTGLDMSLDTVRAITPDGTHVETN